MSTNTRYRLHSIVTTSSSQSTQILTHFVVVKSEIDWAMPVLFGKPSPFLEISLAGQQSYVTNTKSSTITPVWNESLELWMLWLFVAVRLWDWRSLQRKSNDPTSLVSIHLGRPSMERGPKRSIGSTQLSIEDLEELGIFSSGYYIILSYTIARAWGWHFYPQ